MSATLTVYSISSRPLCAAAEGPRSTFTQQARHPIRVRSPIRDVRVTNNVRIRGIVLSGRGKVNAARRARSNTSFAPPRRHVHFKDRRASICPSHREGGPVLQKLGNQPPLRVL